MNPENQTEKSAPKQTASQKLRELLPHFKREVAEHLKGNALVLFAFEGFFALVTFLVDEAEIMEAKLLVASVAIKECVRLGDADQATIRAQADTLRARESELRQEKLMRERVQGDYDALMANLANIQKKPAQGLGTSNDLSVREAYYMFLGAKINAIKALRERTGMGLADAKNAVEHFVMPAQLGELMLEQTKRWGAGCYTVDDRGCNLMCEDLSCICASYVGSSQLRIEAHTMCATVKRR